MCFFSTQIGKLCATPFGIDIVGITEFVALVGALVGGITARQRKAELERLNEQLRKINVSLRQQARAGTVYAPGMNMKTASSGLSRVHACAGISNQQVLLAHCAHIRPCMLDAATPSAFHIRCSAPCALCVHK